MKLKGIISTTGKMIAMIILVVVMTAFLMNTVFKIDVAAWLGNKFGIESPPPSEGKVLYVRLDPFNFGFNPIGGLSPDRTQIHTFTLLSQSSATKLNIEDDVYFWQTSSSFPNNKCTVYVARVINGPSNDQAVIYNVNPGVVIDNDKCNSLATCMAGYSTSGCEPFVRDAGKLKSEGLCKRCIPGVLGACSQSQTTLQPTVQCSGDNHIVDMGDIVPLIGSSALHCIDNSKNPIFVPFCDTSSTCEWNSDSCANGKCSLLVKDSYRVKYGVICGDDGKWHTCSDQTINGQKVNGATCTFDDKTKFYTWSGGTPPASPTPTTPPMTSVNGPASFQAPVQPSSTREMTVSFTDSDSGAGLYKCYYSISDESGRGFTVRDKERPCNGSIKITVGSSDNQFADCIRTGLTGVCYVLSYAKDNAGNPKTTPTSFNPNVKCSEANQGSCYVQIT